MYRSSLSSSREAQANRLAADIIMPMRKVVEEVRRLGGIKDESTAVALAREFKVSLPAMKVRLGLS
jgi:Zn-dependent peptidase ImmA (M78 family)